MRIIPGAILKEKQMKKWIRRFKENVINEGSFSESVGKKWFILG